MKRATIRATVVGRGRVSAFAPFSRPLQFILMSISSQAGGSFVPAGSLAIRQLAHDRWPGQSAHGDSQSLTRSVSLPSSVLAGSALVVFGTQVNNLSAIGKPALADTLSGTTTYTLQRFIDDTSANVSCYVWTAPNVGSGSYTLTATFATVEWQGLFVAEITGVTSSPILATNLNEQTPAGAGTDNVNSGSLVCGATRGLVIALCQNIADNGAISPYNVGSPSVGSGFSGVGSDIWDWNGEENSFIGPSTCAQYRVSNSLGTTTPTFSSKAGGEPYVAMAVALQAA